jgi:hypothetical protein
MTPSFTYHAPQPLHTILVYTHFQQYLKIYAKRLCSSLRLVTIVKSMCWILYVFNKCAISLRRSRDSAVGIVTGSRLDNRGVRVRVPVGSRIFSSLHHPDRFRNPPSLQSNGYWGNFPLGVKRPGREADNSPPTSAEVKKTWICTSTPTYAFMA